MDFEKGASRNDVVQEIRDMSAIFDGIWSLSATQWIVLFENGNPPVSALGQACREALAHENSSMSSPAYGV